MIDWILIKLFGENIQLVPFENYARDLLFALLAVCSLYLLPSHIGWDRIGALLVGVATIWISSLQRAQAKLDSETVIASSNLQTYLLVEKGIISSREMQNTDAAYKDVLERSHELVDLRKKMRPYFSFMSPVVLFFGVAMALLWGFGADWK